MVSWVDGAEELVHHGRIKVPYTWSVGETGSAFFVALRDERKILGSYCAKCDVVFLPPRKVCGRCFGRSMEWRELGHEGTLLTYTIPRYTEKIHPMEAPFAFGLVKLDGAGTGLTHLIGEFKEGGLRSGMRLTAVFRDKPQGNILDIRYFRPV